MKKIIALRRKWIPVIERYQTRGLLSGLRFKIVIDGNHSKINSISFLKYKDNNIIGEIEKNG